MVIDIYGVEAEDYRCGGCLTAKQLFDECGLTYTFHKVLTRGSDGLPQYNLELIDELRKRAHLPNRQIMYPIIFIDDTIVRVKNLKTHLTDLGYNIDFE